VIWRNYGVKAFTSGRVQWAVLVNTAFILSYSIKGIEFLHHLSDYRLLVSEVLLPRSKFSQLERGTSESFRWNCWTEGKTHRIMNKEDSPVICSSIKLYLLFYINSSEFEHAEHLASQSSWSHCASCKSQLHISSSQAIYPDRFPGFLFTSPKNITGTFFKLGYDFLIPRPVHFINN
jgi:hypothetical protein